MEVKGNLFSKAFRAVLIKGAIDNTSVRGKLWIQQDTPVDTGLLKSGWKIKNTMHTMAFENKVPYFSHVEWGTRFMRPRLMYTKNTDRIEALLKHNMAKIGPKLN